MAHDRADEHQPLTEAGLKKVLEHRDRLSKNGESWRSYFRRMTTPQNVLLAVILVFEIGGRYKRVELDLAEALERTQQSARVEAELSSEVRAIQQLLSKIESQPHVNAADLDLLRDRVALAVTRDEFQRVIEQQIIPRLERIEARLAGGGTTTGGGS